MILDSFMVMVRENLGFRQVAEALRPPTGVSTHRYISEVNVHIHEESDSSSLEISGTDAECFVEWSDWGNVCTQPTNREVDSTAAVKGIIKRAASNRAGNHSLWFKNIFVVNHVRSGNYCIINIHRYPPTFFQMIVLDDHELLIQVVRNQLKINGVQLELSREAHLGDFLD